MRDRFIWIAPLAIMRAPSAPTVTAYLIVLVVFVRYLSTLPIPPGLTQAVFPRISLQDGQHLGVND